MTPHTLQGGESQALARLEDYLRDPKWVCGFEKPKTNPSAFLRPATTVLSPYLKFGCLSPRLFHQRLVAIYRGAKGLHSKPPVSLRGQLLWREFFYTVSCAGWSLTILLRLCWTLSTLHSLLLHYSQQLASIPTLQVQGWH